MNQHGRISRLKIEHEKLINLDKRSEFIQIQPVDVQPGWPPEKYIVTFTCLGIASITEAGLPQISNFHQVSIYLSRDFPRQEPYLKWLTPIWHPNIEHKEPYHVCTNNVQNWYPSKALDDLVVVLGEMVQYKRYHAAWAEPWPLDTEAAKWVREHAEPKGIIGPDKPVDERSLLRTYEIRLWGGPAEPKLAPPKKAMNIKIGVKKVLNDSRPITSEETLNRRKGLVLGANTKHVFCLTCGMENRLRLTEVHRIFYCGNCRAPLPVESGNLYSPPYQQ